MIWTAFAIDARCGGCDQTVAPGEPVCLLTPARKKRCASCAGLAGFEVDHAAVDAARLALDAAVAEPKPVSYATRRPEDGFQPLAAIADERPMPAAAPTQPPIPYHDLPASVRRRDRDIADHT